jgi:diguanylate cyclase (GGDEF)-like protein
LRRECPQAFPLVRCMSEKVKPGPLRVGVLISRLEIKYMHLIWQALQNSAARLHVRLVAFVGESLQSPIEPDNQQNFIYSFINKQTVDGVIFVPSVGVFIDAAAYRNFMLHFHDMPGVSLSVKCEGIPSVLIDCAGGIKQAIRHCVDYHRFRRIAFIRGPAQSSEAQDRFRAYKQTLEEYRIPFDPLLVYKGDFVLSSGKKAAHQFLRNPKQRPHVIIAANDDMALGAMQVLHERGLKVPEDLAVIGFDDWEETRFHIPSISSVRQPLRKQAQAALEMLIRMIKGEDPGRNMVLPARFMIRQSCGCFIPEMRLEANGQGRDRLALRQKPPSPITGPAAAAGTGTETPQAAIPTAGPDTVPQIPPSACLEELRARVHGCLDGDCHGVDRFFTLLRRFFDGKMDTSRVLGAFSALLYEQAQNYGDPFPWQEIFHLVAAGLGGGVTDPHLRRPADGLFLKLCLLVTRYRESLQAQRRFSLEATTVALHTVSQRLITAFDFDELLAVIGRYLPILGISSMYVFLFERPILPSHENFWDISVSVRIALAVKQGRPTRHAGRMFPAPLVISHILSREDPKKDWVVMPLAFTTEQFGLILMENGTQADIVYETLRMQISSALKGARLFEQQRHVEVELKKANVELESLSLLDELTGLYNRRGFLTLSSQIWKMAARSGMAFLIVFMDMDGLKIINDNHGHKEGDAVLQAFAEILRMVFRRNDVLARLGGDEFVVLSYNASFEHKENIRQRIENTINRFNADSGKPYTLSVSLGFAFHEKDSALTIDELLKAADREQYRDKSTKKNRQH